MTPIQLDPTTIAPNPRRPLNWVFLSAILGFLIVIALLSLFGQRGKRAESFSQERTELRIAIQVRESAVRFGSRPSETETLPLPARLISAPSDNLEAARLRTVISGENRSPISPIDLAALRKSRDENERLLAAIYAKKRPTKAEAKVLADGVAGAPFEFAVAKEYARRLAGDKDAYARFADRNTLLRRGAVILLGLFVLLGSVVAWCVVYGLRRAGELPMLSPESPIPAFTADQFAARAGFLLLGYLVLTILLIGSPQAFSGIALPLGLVLMVPLILRIPYFGETLSLADVGVTSKNLGRNIGLGFFFLLLELPVSLIVAMLGTQLFKFLPPQHPATEQITNSPSPLVLLTVIFSACVAAPFFEEVTFRGLFFPALHRVSSVVVSLVVTSLTFALLHPQGPALWAGLASVGAFSCVAARYTRSLVPSIVMHFGHNLLILLLALGFTL